MFDVQRHKMLWVSAMNLGLPDTRRMCGSYPKITGVERWIISRVTPSGSTK
jgi:hypothetical protein